MGKFLLGFFTFVLLAGLGYGSILVVDALDLVKKEDLILMGVERLTGIKKFKEIYEIGKKRSAVLQQKENELGQKEARLVAKEKRLVSRQTEYDAEFAALEKQKQTWLKEHPPVSAPKTVASQKANPGITDSTLKTYLATIGAMKPEKAAAVIQKLPEETVFAIFDQLRTSQASKVMENLPAEYLTRITQTRVNGINQ